MEELGGARRGRGEEEGEAEGEDGEGLPAVRVEAARRRVASAAARGASVEEDAVESILRERDGRCCRRRGGKGQSSLVRAAAASGTPAKDAFVHSAPQTAPQLPNPSSTSRPFSNEDRSSPRRSVARVPYSIRVTRSLCRSYATCQSTRGVRGRERVPCVGMAGPRKRRQRIRPFRAQSRAVHVL